MKTKFRRVLLAVVVAGMCDSVEAATGDVKDYTIHNDGVSVRSLGMGGAFTAAVDD